MEMPRGVVRTGDIGAGCRKENRKKEKKIFNTKTVVSLQPPHTWFEDVRHMDEMVSKKPRDSGASAAAAAAAEDVDAADPRRDLCATGSCLRAASPRFGLV